MRRVAVQKKSMEKQGKKPMGEKENENSHHNRL
jgi:hypothetical protein